MADIKTLLKEARKLIDDKNFKDAQECCKNILRKDKNNYFALVLLGKSLQDSDQVPLAYQKAIASKPDHPLAWQGLANYYEGKDGDIAQSKLFTVYKEMLKLPLDEDKALEVITKFGQLGILLKNSDCISTVNNFIINSNNERIKEASEKIFLDLLKAGVPCEEVHIESIVKGFQDILARDPNENFQVIMGKIIIQKSCFASAVEEIIQLNYFPHNILLREWLCNILCKKYIENGSFCNFDIEKYQETVIHNMENSRCAALLKSIILFDKRLYLDAYKQCVPVINYQQPDITEATLVIKCAIMLKKWPIVQKLSSNFLTKVKDLYFASELRKFLFYSLVRQQKWKQAVSVSTNIPMENLDIIEQVALSESLLECGENCSNLLENLKTTEYYPQLQALALMKEKKYQEAVTLLEDSKDCMKKFFLMGRAHWELEQYDKCLVNLLMAAKLDPEHSDTFYYIGHYYYRNNDLEKAKKCYEKSYNINPNDDKIIKSLSEVYAALNLKESDFDLLLSAEKTLQSNETWLYFRLGLHYLNKREWENAIIHFRHVIKNNYNDITALECLADAYYSRGSYTSALRAYNRVIEMNSSKSSHCFTRIGYIYCLLTQYEDAIETFKKVLDIDSQSILALKGLAETWIRIAKKKLTAKLYGSARDCAQNAVNYIIKVITQQKHYNCFWKLLGDTLMFITKLPSKFSYVYIKESLKEEENFIKKDNLDIYPIAISCYSQIAKQKQHKASYDLASAYLSYYHDTKKIVNCNISYNLAISCVKENPSSWRNWNLLGKICLFIKKYEIAQHCFIKALLVTHKWSVAKIWCNLGTLYLKLKHYKIANYCFWRGQSTLPSYPQSWIGQALIAEVIREEEAMDLFRHASRLGYHPESALGYADWVCRTLKDNKYNEDPDFKYVIEGLYAINYAIDLLEWFSNFEPNNACASNIFGILQERSGLLRAALKSYEKALQYADDNKKNIVLLNIGRVLLRLQKYDEAIKVYKAITEASLNSTCGLALALFKKGSYEESYSVYDTALHWLSNEDNEKADLLVAMAGIMYMFKGVNDAKTILFHSIQISQKKPTAYSLFGICSLGLIHTDQSLTKLALTELQKYERDSNFGFDIGFLKSYMFVYDDNVDQAIKLLSDSLHDHPNNPQLWFCMAEYCLKTTTRAKIASICSQRAICSADLNNASCDSAKMIATASIAEHMAGDINKAFVLAKRGLHVYPNNADIWAALLFSLLSYKLWMDRKEWITSVAAHMRRHLNISRPLSRWVSLLEKKIYK